MTTLDPRFSSIHPRTARAPFALAALVAASFLSLGACKSTSTEAPKAPVTRVKVSAAVVAEGLAPRILPLTGSLRGEQQSDLAAGAGGRLLKVSVE
ncbi:MAG: efflux RND transporter periplasmic adaptor subunit, partial [Myxococcales bacterium]|nr:efflux RND transporter periplasmic adaptor subunit [Myxococcales bacterium]